MEGTTVNVKDKIAYSAMSRIEKSMIDGTVPGMQVQANSAGAVYQLHLKSGQVDTTGQAIDSEWVPVDMAAEMCIRDRALEAHAAGIDAALAGDRQRAAFGAERQRGAGAAVAAHPQHVGADRRHRRQRGGGVAPAQFCLLYTSRCV